MLFRLMSIIINLIKIYYFTMRRVKLTYFYDKYKIII